MARYGSGGDVTSAVATRRGITALAAALVCACAGVITLAAPQAVYTRLEGRVVAADTGAPIRGALVRLTIDQQGGEATTDGGGQFEFFVNVRAGGLTLTLVKGGYVTQTYRGSIAGGAIEVFTPQQSGRVLPGAVAGSTLRFPDLVLPRGGVIAGRVFDRAGEPVASAAVTALRVVYERPGAPQLTTGGFDHTNDLGEYRIFGLHPGTYFVMTGRPYEVERVSAAGGFRAAASGSVPPIHARTGPTYFPATPMPAEARAISIGAGEQALGTDIRLSSATYAIVSGRVVDSQGQPGAETTVILSIPQPAGAHVARLQMTETDPLGQFSFGAVPPGPYRVDAVALASPGAFWQRQGGTEPAAGRPVAEFGSQDVNAVGDVQLHLATRPGFEIRGRVLVDGVVAARTAASVTVEAVAVADYNKRMTLGSGVEEDGSFVIGRMAGRRLIRVTGLPAQLALQRIVARGVDVTEDGIDVTDAEFTDIEVHLTSRPSRLEGDIVDATGKPISEVVIVFSEDPRFWRVFDSRRVRRVSAASGRFTVVGLPPGRYLVAVAPPFDLFEWADPVSLEGLRPYAGAVTLSEGAATTVRLTVR